jgi:hypothetical protein
MFSGDFLRGGRVGAKNLSIVCALATFASESEPAHGLD